MKYHSLLPIQVCLSLFCLFALSSCEDKELVKKNEALLNQITELETKIASIEAQVGEDPGDQEANLKHANENLASTLNKLQKLDSKKEQLAAQLATTEKEFQDYQNKYKIQK